ncbi:ubiquitin carboxyl-terminal hydrolase 2-like [Coffea eugenioides]|uniref:ubiquitin carboxyl-terminal hydrolase 2-like n=1 Tax=Coffea eugenioides TaxID=49369 RepID=UPI000F60D32E|nr:ubiquitin carboxyl-terminal hydrolase 2-like [Coffea eugenioides]
MGKKAKKNPRSGHKDKRVSAASAKTNSQQQNTIANVDKTTDDGTTVVLKDKRVCSHLDKGVNLEKLSAKFGSSESFKCEDCRDGGDGRRGGKGKVKQGKKKGGAESRTESKAIWVCLECGHFSCGGVGLPTTPQTHAIRHAKQNHHSLAIQLENPQLRWCFRCNILIGAEKSEDGVEEKDVLHEVVKMMKIRRSDGAALDAEDVWFGSGSVTSTITSEKSAVVGSGGRDSYVVRGLINLGNTCFFNSVMQNLLALDRVRGHFFKLDGCFGPLTAAFKKLVSETNPDSGLRNVINPRSFFGCVCAKAPQFRGYQQQDSHELLRCLLDALSTEELSAKNRNKSSQEDGNSDPTFVDAIFGGQLSSTVTCLECGYSSLVYEPYLDLSLPVPTKKPPSKKVQQVNRAKKPKPPPRRNARIRPKMVRDTNDLPSTSTSDAYVDRKSSSTPQSSVHIPEQNVVSSGGSATDVSVMADTKSITADCLSSDQHAQSNKAVESIVEKPIPADDFTWLDFLEADTVSNNDNMTSQMDDLSINHGSADENTVQNEVLQNSLDSCGDNISTFTDTACCSRDEMQLVHHGKEKLLNAQDMASQIDEKVVLDSSGCADTMHSEANWENSSELSSLTCSRDLNLGVDSLGKFSEEETPLLVQESEVLLLPYKEDTCDIVKTDGDFFSSAIGCEQDSMEFDGFGDLFNEPEATGPSMNPSSMYNASETNEVLHAGFGGNSSESEPDEVDNTDAPVSVQSCLSYFTKPELLSKNEHAWQCENCAKVLQEQKIRSRKKLLNPWPEEMTELGKATRASGLSPLQDSSPFSSEVRHLCNGYLKNETVDPSDDSFPSHSTETDVKQNVMHGENAEVNSVDSSMEGEKCDADLANVCLPGTSDGDMTLCKLGDNCKRHDGCHVRCTDGKVQKDKFCTGTGKCETEETKDDEKNAEKVERDATKRILINSAPPILTIHLKRFSQDARGRLSKLNGYVQFDRTIDLKSYMDPRCMERDRYKYNLVGVVEHMGSMRGGHYVAYVRGGMKNSGNTESQNGDYVWYHASDVYVREASLEEVLHSEAYILFYERV